MADSVNPYHPTCESALRHVTSEIPKRSAIGFDVFRVLSRELRGMWPNPASQLAQCHASALSIFSARITKLLASPWMRYE